TVRLHHADSLWLDARDPSCSRSISIVMALCDLLSRPDLWPTLFQYLHGLTQITVWPDVNLGEAAALAQWRSRLIAAVGTFGDGCRVDGLSPLPAMVLLVAGLRSLRDELGAADG